MKAVSVLSIASPTLNPRFLSIFSLCRKQYENNLLNQFILDRGEQIYSNREEGRKLLQGYFSMTK